MAKTCLMLVLYPMYCYQLAFVPRWVILDLTWVFIH